jgi:hypothetical protein
MASVLNYSKFISLFEGGAAVKSARRIKEREVPATLESIEQAIIPLLGGGTMGEDYLIIGSIGKKNDPEDTSGDIDLGVDQSFIARKLNLDPNNILEGVEKVLTEELPDILGFTPEMKLMKGINVLSIGWPIEGDPTKGIVQLDLIPISGMDWAKFIFYSPDYRKNESKYKSAHRNWLIQSILSALKEVESKDEEGNVENYSAYSLRLSDGIFKNKKTFRGATKRLKNPTTIQGTNEFITRDPDEVIKMVFGPGYSQDDVNTFEKAWSIVCAPNYMYKDKLDQIKTYLKDYLQKGDFEIPSEII